MQYDEKSFENLGIIIQVENITFEIMEGKKYKRSNRKKREDKKTKQIKENIE